MCNWWKKNKTSLTAGQRCFGSQWRRSHGAVSRAKCFLMGERKEVPGDQRREWGGADGHTPLRASLLRAQTPGGETTAAGVSHSYIHSPEDLRSRSSSVWHVTVGKVFATTTTTTATTTTTTTTTTTGERTRLQQRGNSWQQWSHFLQFEDTFHIKEKIHSRCLYI